MKEIIEKGFNCALATLREKYCSQSRKGAVFFVQKVCKNLNRDPIKNRGRY